MNIGLLVAIDELGLALQREREARQQLEAQLAAFRQELAALRAELEALKVAQSTTPGGKMPQVPAKSPE